MKEAIHGGCGGSPEGAAMAVRRAEFGTTGQLIPMFVKMQRHKVDLWDCKFGKLTWLQVYTLGLVAQLGCDRIVSVTSGGRCMATS